MAVIQDANKTLNPASLLLLSSSPIPVRAQSCAQSYTRNVKPQHHGPVMDIAAVEPKFLPYSPPSCMGTLLALVDQSSGKSLFL